MIQDMIIDIRVKINNQEEGWKNGRMNEYISADNPKGFYLAINKYELPIKRLINSLNELKRNYSTYEDPDAYVEMLKSSVAAEINNR